MQTDAQKPMITAARKILVPFLEILTYVLLLISLASVILLRIAIREGNEAGDALLNLSAWMYGVLRAGLLAFTFLSAFISLLVLPFKKKLWILIAMILLAVLTRGLL